MVSTPGRGSPGTLPKLHAIDADADQGVVILATRRGAKKGSYSLVVDEALIAQIHSARQPSDPQSAIPVRSGVESQLTPREIQIRLRAGRTVEQVAAEAGVEPEWVDRFAAPVRAEQLAAVQRAGRSTLHTPRKGPSERPLEASVLRNLAERGVMLAEEDWSQAWSARHLVDSDWLVALTFRNRGRTMVAEWLLNAANGALTSRNRLATDLGYIESSHRSAPPGPVAAPTATAARPRRAKKAAGTRTPATGRVKQAAAVKKAVGRPKKAAAVKKAVGRPKKAAAVKKAVGRPKQAAAVKKAVGRPKKAAAVVEASPVKKTLGRPRKAVAVTAPPVKKAVGRPRKTAAVLNTTPVRNSVGRPRKAAAVVEAAPVKKAVGRPRKATAVVEAAPVKKVAGGMTPVDSPSIPTAAIQPRSSDRIAARPASSHPAAGSQSAPPIESQPSQPLRERPPRPVPSSERPLRAAMERPLRAAPPADLSLRSSPSTEPPGRSDHRPAEALPAGPAPAVEPKAVSFPRPQEMPAGRGIPPVSFDESMATRAAPGAERRPEPYAPLERLLSDRDMAARQDGSLTIPISSGNGIQPRSARRPLRALRLGEARRPAPDYED